MVRPNEIELDVSANGPVHLVVEFRTGKSVSVRLFGRRRLDRMIRRSRPSGPLRLRPILERFAVANGYRLSEFEAGPAADYEWGTTVTARLDSFRRSDIPAR
jgi:hypothetical protein